jgi:hypothetical protein
LFPVAVVPGRRSIKLPANVTAHLWPVMLGEGAGVPLETGTPEFARFELAGEELSSLFGFSVEARQGARRREERFTLNLTLEGAPEDRRERVLRSVLRDRDRVLRYLLFLLAAGDPQQAAPPVIPEDDATDSKPGLVGPTIELPLFESLLQALKREPSRLDHVDRVINDLRKSPEGEALIPDGFLEIWEPIWTAREALRHTQ